MKSPEEARAAEEAGVDLMSCSFDSPESQARLPGLIAAAPTSFLSGVTPHGLALRGNLHAFDIAGVGVGVRYPVFIFG